MKIKREDIEIISRHSNWSEQRVASLLKKEIYNTKTAWHKFLNLFFISLGIGFTTAGIIFFFAYNWADLHKFLKIGLVISLIISSTLFVLLSKLDLQLKNIILTGVSVIVGVLFAVFGQIYQTGANSYDFFLGWTVFITLWVIISNFAPLWLVFIILVNTTLVLYEQQVSYGWSELTLLTTLIALNAFFLLLSLTIKKYSKNIQVPIWFSKLLALGTIYLCTSSIVTSIFTHDQSIHSILYLLCSILYAAGIYYGLSQKSIFYLAIIYVSLIFILVSLFIKAAANEGMFLFITVFVIFSTTLAIKNLIKLQKKWNN